MTRESVVECGCPLPLWLSKGGSIQRLPYYLRSRALGLGASPGPDQGSARLFAGMRFSYVPLQQMRTERLTAETNWGIARRILLVDKEIWSREGMAADLGREGCEMFAVATASEAIRSLHEDKPEIVIIDLSFPSEGDHAAGTSWDDFLILSWLQQGKAGVRLPFIVISSDGEKYRERALESGALDFLQKPIQHESLLAAIERAILIAAVPGEA
jgi:CheY-like chemotaxis protein